jgi:hypothetical protein
MNEVLRQKFAIVAASMLGLFVGISASRIGASADEQMAADNGVVKSLAAVPEAPEELKPLLDRGKVLFRFGGRRPSTVNGMKSTGRREQIFDAETQFQLRYEFSCQCRWSWLGEVLTVGVTYNKLKLVSGHEIWMAHEPSGEFWDSRLLMHEMDHVRLSSDPRMLAMFNQRVKGESELKFTAAKISEILGIPVAPSRQFSSEDVRTLVNSSVKVQFDRIVELVDIRYAELDRVTVHGGQAVPTESEVARWLESAKD